MLGYNPPAGYSGGRYYSWMVAEGLALAGHEVTYLTNHRPAFLGDFKDFPAHRQVRLRLTHDFFWDLPRRAQDLLILVPHRDLNPSFYFKAEMHARLIGAQLASISFETPNWFNGVAPVAHDTDLWKHWRQLGRRMRLIISLTATGQGHAQKWFGETNGTRFDYCYPPINTIVADAVEETAGEPRIVLFGRFSNAQHKGSDAIDQLLDPAMKGHRLHLIVGTGKVPDAIRQGIEERTRELGIGLQVHHELTDREKFQLIKGARLLMFPSLFEGYGIPPVEAQYCNVRCVAFDLPVLREVNKDGIRYAEYGNYEDFRRLSAEALAAGPPPAGLREAIEPVARFEAFADRIGRVIEQGLAGRAPEPARELSTR